MNTIDHAREARRLHDIRTVLGLTANVKWIVCPLPQHHSGKQAWERTASFSIFNAPDGYQRFKCHGVCGLQGDVVDLVGYMSLPNYDPTNGDHVRMALSRLDSKFEPEQVSKEKPARLEKGLWKTYLPPSREVLCYAAMRGLNEDTVKKFKLGKYKSFMSIPSFEEGENKGIKFRNTGPGIRFWSVKGSVNSLFNHDAVLYTEKPVLIMKGEIPVMLADQLGFMACCSTGGEGADMSKYMPALAFSARRLVVADNDRDEKTRREIVRLTNKRAKSLHAEVVYPPEQYKDWDEWYLNDPGGCLETTEEWVWKTTP